MDKEQLSQQDLINPMKTLEYIFFQASQLLVRKVILGAEEGAAKSRGDVDMDGKHL